MSDLISRQAAIKAIHDEFDECLVWDESGECTANEVERVLDGLPVIDAVPVVRCKECKYYREGEKLSPQKFCFRLRGRDGAAIGYNFAEDDFCSYGERSEDPSHPFADDVMMGERSEE